MPHQSLLYAGRVHACANLPQMMPNRSRIVSPKGNLKPICTSAKTPKAARRKAFAPPVAND
jgi:hypothetical protein